MMRCRRVLTELALLSCCSLAASCDKPSPAKVCAAADTQDQSYSLIFDAAERMIGSIGLGDPVQSRVRNELEQMRREHLMGFDFATVDGADKTTRKISCSGKLRLKLDVQDQTSASQAILASLIGPAANDGITPPDGLAAGSATAMINYARQPSAADSGTFVYTVDNVKEVASGLVLIATERVLARVPKAAAVEDVANSTTTEQASSSAMSTTTQESPGSNENDNSTGDADAVPDDAPPPPPPTQRQQNPF